MATQRTLTTRTSPEGRVRVEGVSLMGARASLNRVGDVLVAAQFTLIGLCLLPIGPVVPALQLAPIGVVLVALALVVGGLALLAMGSSVRVHPVPSEDAELRTDGIYGVIRHPMYTSVLLATLGITLVTGRAVAAVAVLALCLVLPIKARFEDRLLEERFGWQFAVYASRVPAVIPQPWRPRRR